MTDLERISKVVDDLFDIMDTARSNFGEEGYNALDKARQAVTDAWNVCKRGQERRGINNSHKPIKSFRDASNEDTSNDYGFYWEGDYVYDKNKLHWYFGDYTNGNTGIEPYSSYIQAVKETEDSIRESFTEDEIPDPEDYAYQLIDFAVETLPDPGKYIKEYEGFVKSSRKSIKSDRVLDDYHNKEIYRQAFASLIEDTQPDEQYPGSYRVLVDGCFETNFSANSREEAIQKFKDYFANKKKGINNSKKPIKSSLEDVLHEYRKYGAYMPGSYIEQLISTMYNLLPEDGKLKVDDFIHGDWDPLEGKMVPRNTVKSSTIKSSLEDKLVPYLEEFEEGYADALTSTDEMGGNARLDTFYEIFKNDYNLSDDDISKLEGAVHDIWRETEEENIEHDMGEMYGAPHGATPEEALKVFESRKPIKSGSMSGWFGGICDKCKQYTNVHYVGYNGRKLCMKCSRGR